MPAYGNAATILNFPDYYASNRIAEPKVLSGGISTGNWGKGAGLPGTRTTTTGVADNTAFLKGYNLDAVPEGLQQNADMTREVLNMYADLRAVHAGFAKKGINLGAINPADPIQVEAFSIYNNLAKEYVNKLNMVKQGAINQKIIADKQAGNTNLIPMQLDDTRPITQADVLATTPVATPSFIEKWNTEGRTSAKSQAEYEQRLVDYKRTIDNIDMFGQMGGQPPQTVEFWKSQVLAPTPFTPEVIDPLDIRKKEAEIRRINAQTAQAQAAAEYTRGKTGELKEGKASSQASVYYQTVGGFVNDMERKGLLVPKKDANGNVVKAGGVPVMEASSTVPIYDVAPDTFIEQNAVPNLPRVEMAVSRVGEKAYSGIIYARSSDGMPIYYLLEPHTKSIPPESSGGQPTSVPGYKLKKVNGAGVFPQNDPRKGMPVGFYSLSGDVKGSPQRDDTDVLGFEEFDFNPMGQQSTQSTPSNQGGSGVRKPRPVNPLD